MSRAVKFRDLSQLSSSEREALLLRAEADLDRFLEAVKPIIAQVRAKGDQALVHFAAEFDRAQIEEDSIKCRPEEFEAALESLEPEVLEAIRYAGQSIRLFHERQMPESMRFSEVRPGVFAGDKFSPIPSVACYVPRGKGSFHSVVLMTSIPAVVAGVPRVSIVTPPGPDGNVDTATLAAARIAGVEDVYKCGGAQAVAAVAYGTQTVPKAHKIVGPGSPWVVAAKRLLADVIDPGIPAGPSEAIILADRTAPPRVAALDLIIESEHGPDSSAFLVTDSQDLAQAAMRAVPEYWKSMGQTRVEFSSTVLGSGQGGIILAPDMDQAIDFVNDYAPEHLEVLSQEPFKYLGRLTNAGEILLGPRTPITLGNFVLGPNAVLPTGGAARTFSPLSVYDFVKMTSIGYVTSGAYDELARQARILARYEGFDGHALAVSEARKAALEGQ
ncbi:MAG: histidinol dehydrogenase [Deltaproteobacteria bacterium]|nr:histidinol dehydrogenase [Deltaproteobacteria bacterium]